MCIERKVIAVLLLLLLALAPAMAQNVVQRGDTIPLAVERMQGDIYTWELYNNPNGNFANKTGTAVADGDVEFVGSNIGSSVLVHWIKSGIYFFKVTAIDANGCTNNIKIGRMEVHPLNLPPNATDDVFILNSRVINGDLLYTDNGNGKDNDPDGNAFFIDTNPVVRLNGLTLNPDGSFVYMAEQGFRGDVRFEYRIYDTKKSFSFPATAIIHIVSDMDHDGQIDDSDPDADGDGILNVIEGGQTTDTDDDGLPNYLDIDSDDDGIVDNFESQSSAGYIAPSNLDDNKNGVDDAYDTAEIIPWHTNDGDGNPDFLDPDSDNDGVSDKIEGHDFIEGRDPYSDGKPDHVAKDSDADDDGLDVGYDTVDNGLDALRKNALGSNATMQDSDGDGQPDWRDDDDDDDQILTKYEDLNGDGDFSNDDIDYDGYPEYLDFGRECDLFIPNSFSPNDDNIHDFYQIYCINHYPNARLYVFDQLGNKLYDKAHYGNIEFWGSYESSWWCGKPDYGTSSARNKKVDPGTYYYVLDLGNGEVKKSFLFVSY